MRCVAIFAASLLATTAGAAFAEGQSDSTSYGASGPTPSEPVDVRTPGGAMPAAFAMALTEQGHTFLKKAVQTNLAEIQLAEMALDKDDLPDRVTTAAEHVLEDHKAAQEEVESMASSYDLNLPDEPSDRQKESAEMLEDLSGDQFAAEYARILVEEHQRAIELFEQQAQSSGGGNDPLQQYAANQLPALRKHLTMAQELQAEYGATASSD
ncbi:DUF4142 domain-containing protein [Indioceanicola profundi]|uniref:DUF4142 domain-containing protein n=1 Tax=Indioceanicola profundi TaxID=2220096 RepID=UPI0013C3E652|nr:DUF4142 domain-containing protein [Indioceanicola profundi]